MSLKLIRVQHLQQNFDSHFEGVWVGFFGREMDGAKGDRCRGGAQCGCNAS